MSSVCSQPVRWSASHRRSRWRRRPVPTREPPTQNTEPPPTTTDPHHRATPSRTRPKPLLIASGVTVGDLAVGWMTPPGGRALKTVFQAARSRRQPDPRVRAAPQELGAARIEKAVRGQEREARSAHSARRGDFAGEAPRLSRAHGRRFDREAVDAGVVLRGVKPRVIEAEPGRRLKVLRNALTIRKALARHLREPIGLDFEALKPKVLNAKLGPSIVILRDSKTLLYYVKEKLVRKFGIATGQASYPTPTGDYEIVNMQLNPWWYPPPSDWAADADPVPPGPGNPLGTRWMGLRRLTWASTGRRTPRPSATPRRTAASGCASPRPSGSSGTWTSGRRCSSSPGSRMGRRLLLVAQGVAVGLVVLLFALLLWKLVEDEGGGLARAATRGDLPPAPDFTLERLDREGELSLAELRGKAVVVNFWASWCIPCKEEAPFLEQVWRSTGATVSSWSASTRRTSARRAIVHPQVRLDVPDRLRRAGRHARALRHHRFSRDVRRRPGRAGHRGIRRRGELGRGSRAPTGAVTGALGQ